MKFISWNVNGLRACVNKGFLDSFYDLDADFFCLQETKLQEGQIRLDLPGYEQYWCYAEKKGYSGTAIFTKHTPLGISYGLGIAELDTEGRVITLEYPEFFLVTCYTPNAQRGLARIAHRLKWEEAFRDYVKELDQKKPVIICGDLNVAHREIDLKNPASNRGSAGFSDEERSAFTQLLDSGFTDTFRWLYPDKTGAYSWWSYMFNARQNNAGWRIDYFLVSNRLQEKIIGASIHPEIMGSDHCPVGLELDTTCNGGIWSPGTQNPSMKTPIRDNDEAAGDPPVGLSHTLFKIYAFALIGLVLLMPGFRLLKGPRETEPSDPPSTQAAAPYKLIERVIQRSGTLTLTSDISYMSVFQEYFTDGHNRWKLGPIPANMYDPHPQEANFCLQVEFSSQLTFSDQDKPAIRVINHTAPDGSVTGAYTVLRYYYGTDDTVAGCFIYGRTTDILSLEIIASHRSFSCSTGPVQVFPIITIPTKASTLLKAAIDRTGTLSMEYEPHHMISGSVFPVCFTNGIQTWPLTPAPGSIFPNQANYFIQLVFPEPVPFRDCPAIALTDHTPRSSGETDHVLSYIYYCDDEGRIGGCFVFGYDRHNPQLEITLSYQGIKETTGILTVAPDPKPLPDQLLSTVYKWESILQEDDCFINTLGTHWQLAEEPQWAQELGDRAPTFCYEFPFPKDACFSPLDPPQICLTASYLGNSTGMETDVFGYRFYYNDIGELGGFFVYGCLSEEMFLDVTVRYGPSETTRSYTFTPENPPVPPV